MSRIQKINDEIRKEAAEIVRSELKDPRIGTLTSVTRAETTSDLKYCKVFVSILGDDSQKKDVMEGLRNAAPFMRKLLAMRINLRNTPEVRFELDESLEYGIHMEELIRRIREDEGRE